MNQNLHKPEQTPEFVVIGQVLRPHGIRGELRIRPLAEDRQRYKLLQQVFLHKADERRPCTIRHANVLADAILLHLEEISDRNEAERWRGAFIEIPGDQVQPLPEGKHYYFELDGFTVVTDGGELVGRLVDVHSYPAHDIYIVQSESREYMIPAVAEFVIKTDMEKRQLVIKALDGLLD